MTYVNFMTYIYNWAEANTTALVIFADQNAPRPDELYVTLKITGISNIGHREYDEPDNITEERTVKYEDEITVSIQAYGSGALGVIQDLKESLKKESVIISLDDDNIAKRRDEPMTNLSTLIDNVIEERWGFDVTFGLANTITENVGIIETIEYTETFNSPV